MAPMIVTNEKGKQVGVLVPLKDYEKMMKALEDAADERAYDRAMRRKEETIPLREAIKLRKEKRKQQNGNV
jgi:PHD/YefM family antitoxin component YafN of YafNO toxin-antitoxin module